MKLVRENIEFKRGRKSVTGALGIGIFHHPWDQEKLDGLMKMLKD